MKPELVKAIEAIQKQFGKTAIMELGSSTKLDVDVIPSGSLAVDVALGIGGFPRGRVVEIYGPECIYEETFVPYSTIHRDGKRANHKGGSIKRLYERFHKLPSAGDGRGKYSRVVTEDAQFFAPAVNEHNRIVSNRIKNVVKSGKKDCFRISTSTGQIIASADHKFYTEKGFIPLRELRTGDRVFVHLNTPFRAEKKKDRSKYRVDLFVKAHPIAGEKKIRAVVNRTTGEKQTYSYKRLARSRAVIEAHLNGMSLEDYVGKLNSGLLDGLKFLSRDQHVHHKDENGENDSLENLEILSAEEHGRLHAMERHNNLRFVATLSEITEIMFAGTLETYDLQMEEPYNNFVADEFVVHNSGGKTTLTLHLIAQTQKLGGTAAFLDAEHALDPTYARALGVDTKHLLVSQPDNGEEALEIAEALIKSGNVDIVVIDSVAALVPRAELEGNMGDPQMGLQARMMSQAMRKLTAITSKSKTCLVFINQIRDKIGVMFGSPETTTGGRALKFYSSIRVDIRRMQTISEGEVKTANKTKIKVVKNKLAAPFREAEVELVFGEGICNVTDVVNFAVEHGLVEKAGAWYTFNGQRFQGFDAIKSYFKVNPTLFSGLEKTLREKIFGGKE